MGKFLRLTKAAIGPEPELEYCDGLVDGMLAAYEKHRCVEGRLLMRTRIMRDGHKLGMNMLGRAMG